VEQNRVSTVIKPVVDMRADAPRRAGLPWPWLVWLMVFYAGWLTIMLVGNHVRTTIEHWPIALAMSAGSYVAGSTPMGGGTVGFPILVLLFDMPASIGRNFSFAVQSIGMTSASIFILSTGKPYAKRVLLWAMLGSLVGTPLGAAFVAPHANDLLIKLLFAVIWASFGVMTLVRVREMARYTGITRVSPTFERRLGLFTGLFGGACMASLTGVGIDMLVYTLLVLVLRSDLKIAIPTSVMIMAWTSLVGLASNVALGTVEPEVWFNWLAAAPIVALGAPLGVFVVNRIGRAPTLVFVSVLCIGQFVWTLVNERVSVWVGLIAVVGVLLANLAYHLLYVAGGHLAHRRVEERIL
jgi:uncharacterized membrane protein YfcA